MAIDAGMMDSVTNANFKILAESATQNMVSHQNRLNMLAESSLAQMLNKLNGLDPTEAAAVTKVSESGLAEKVAELGAAISSIQMSLKGAQTTLPETGQG
jgi:hypothetical protein